MKAIPTFVFTGTVDGSISQDSKTTGSGIVAVGAGLSVGGTGVSVKSVGRIVGVLLGISV
jgi:hypothetical protein